MKKLTFSTILLLTVMIIFWAFTPVAIAYVKAEFSLMFQIWMRYISSASFLWILVLINPSIRRSLKTIVSRPLFYWGRLSITAGFTILFQLGFTFCFFLIAPAFGMLLYECQVLFSLLLGVLFFKSERVLMKQPMTMFGISGAIGGAVMVIVFQRGGVDVAFNLGILMAMGAAISWSFVGVSLRLWIKDRIPPLLTVTLVFTLVVIYITPAVLLTGEWITGDPGFDHWLVMIGSGLLGIAGGQGIYYHLLPRLGIITAASVQLLVPFFTGVLSFLMFREIITPFQMIGGFVLLIGCRIILVQKGKLGQG